VIGGAPLAGIGFIEAHGLALIMGVLLWRAEPTRTWHVTAAAVHILLGTANLLFWQIFSVAGALIAGYVTTSLHWLFAGLQLFAATAHANRAHSTNAGFGSTEKSSRNDQDMATVTPG
jgi:hypothetical protein